MEFLFSGSWEISTLISIMVLSVYAPTNEGEILRFPPRLSSVSYWLISWWKRFWTIFIWTHSILVFRVSCVCPHILIAVLLWNISHNVWCSPLWILQLCSAVVLQVVCIDVCASIPRCTHYRSILLLFGALFFIFTVAVFITLIFQHSP